MVACGLACEDLAGDTFSFLTVRKFAFKGWVNALVIPYTVLYAIACAASLLSISIKVQSRPTQIEAFVSQKLASLTSGMSTDATGRQESDLEVLALTSAPPRSGRTGGEIGRRKA